MFRQWQENMPISAEIGLLSQDLDLDGEDLRTGCCIRGLARSLVAHCSSLGHVVHACEVRRFARTWRTLSFTH
jgi:hypothetical protein